MSKKKSRKGEVERNLVESDDKHLDISEHVDGTWIRHHNAPRSNLFSSKGVQGGPEFIILMETRLTERCFPDGAVGSLTDNWRSDDFDVEQDASLWRGRTMFYSQQQEAPPPQPKEALHSQVKPPKLDGRIRKLVEICSLTVMMIASALASTSFNWTAMTSISIEQGFDLLTPKGRDDAEA